MILHGQWAYRERLKDLAHAGTAPRPTNEFPIVVRLLADIAPTWLMSPFEFWKGVTFNYQNPPVRQNPSVKPM